MSVALSFECKLVHDNVDDGCTWSLLVYLLTRMQELSCDYLPRC